MSDPVKLLVLNIAVWAVVIAAGVSYRVNRSANSCASRHNVVLCEIR